MIEYLETSLRLSLTSAWVALVLGLSACATLPGSTEPPYLSLISIEPVELTPLEQKYHLKVRLQNPNDRDLDLSGMSYVLEVNGHSFLKGVSNEAVTIPRYGESIIELSGVSTLFGFVRQIQTLQEHPEQGINYRLSGRLSTPGGFGGLPFSYEGTLLPPATGAGGI